MPGTVGLMVEGISWAVLQVVLWLAVVTIVVSAGTGAGPALIYWPMGPATGLNAQYAAVQEHVRFNLVQVDLKTSQRLEYCSTAVQVQVSTLSR